MKRVSTILFVAALTLPSFAQLNGDGFYRVQNAPSKRYATIVDNKAEKKEITSTSNADLYALNTKNFEDVVSDPGSIIYIEKSGDNGYILRGQGMDTYKLSGLYLKIHSSYEVEGAYYLYGTKVVAGAPMTRYIKEAYNSAFNFYYMATEIKRNINSCSWNLIPVTESESQYFGVKPEIEVGGKYYTTLYTSFAYQLSTGMKAYYIKHNNEEMAEMTEIEGGLIPEATPVIIECTSNKVADNKLTPLSSTSKSNIQNTLKGVYFCNVIKWAMDDEEEIEHPNWNTTKYDAAKMRILGNINGKLGFVKADNLKYLPANKAYLPVQANASSNIELVDEATYAAGIEDIATKDNTSSKGIYTLTGSKIKTENKEGLPAGVYIINGKKAIIRK